VISLRACRIFHLRACVSNTNNRSKQYRDSHSRLPSRTWVPHKDSSPRISLHSNWAKMETLRIEAASNCLTGARKIICNPPHSKHRSSNYSISRSTVTRMVLITVRASSSLHLCYSKRLNSISIKITRLLLTGSATKNWVSLRSGREEVRSSPWAHWHRCLPSRRDSPWIKACHRILPGGPRTILHWRCKMVTILEAADRSWDKTTSPNTNE
jgi:hypothetical protein